MVGLKAPVTSLWETQWEGQVCSLLCGGKCPTWWENLDGVGPVVGNVQNGRISVTVLDLRWEMSNMVEKLGQC